MLALSFHIFIVLMEEKKFIVVVFAKHWEINQIILFLSSISSWLRELEVSWLEKRNLTEAEKIESTQRSLFFVTRENLKIFTY